MQKQNEKPKIGERINDFVQNHRRAIVFSAGAVVLVLVIGVTTIALKDAFNKKAIGIAEDFLARYEALLPSMSEGSENSDVTELLAELEPFAQKTSGYAGGMAWSIIGNIHSRMKNWAEAETAWKNVARKTTAGAIASAAWFNAGAAAEGQGNTDEAIEYYTRSLSVPAGFPSASRAQFSVGRLKETLHDKEAAIEAYRAVISGWPNDTVWASKARSRIIALQLL